MSDYFPPIDERLVAALATKFKNQAPALDTPERQVWFDAGAAHYEALYALHPKAKLHELSKELHRVNAEAATVTDLRSEIRQAGLLILGLLMHELLFSTSHVVCAGCSRSPEAIDP